MADPNQKQNEQQKLQGEQRVAQQPAQAEKREYVVKHKIVQGGRDNRKAIDPRTTPTLRLTDVEAKRLGDAVALKRDSDEAPR